MLSLSRLSRSLWFQFSIGYVLLFFATLLFILLLTLWLGERYLQQQIDGRIAFESRFLMFEYDEGGIAELLEEIEERVDRRTLNAPLLYSLKNANNVAIFDQVVPTLTAGWRTEHSDDTLTSYRFYSVQLADGYLFSVGSRLTSIHEFKQTIKQAGMTVLFIALLISAVTGVIFSRSYTKHLHEVIHGLRKVADGNFNYRLGTQYRSHEFTQLSDEINRMIKHLQRLMANLQQVSKGLAHDLKTPITILSHHLTEIKETAGKPCEPSINKAQVQIDKILEHFDHALLLAEIESGALIDNFENFDFSHLLNDMIEVYEPLFEEQTISIKSDVAANLSLFGMPSLMTRVLSNIFDNVIEHTYAQSQLSISLNQNKGKLALNIQSHCPTPQENTVTQTLHFGLGLKIIGAIIELHRGKCSTHSTSSTFQYQLTLPSAQEPVTPQSKDQTITH